MTGRYEARLDNHPLTDAGANLMITDVIYSAPEERVQAEELGGADGSRMQRVTRSRLSVSLTILLRERDPMRRQAAYAQVQRWARGGGSLTLTDRPGQRLQVDDVRLSGLGSTQRWTDALQLTCIAYNKPYWESEYPAVATLGTAALESSALLTPRGNAASAVVDVDITAVGGTINALTLTAGDTTMSFAALGLAAGATLTLEHAKSGLLVIRAGTTSKLDKRTAASADELLLTPGLPGLVRYNANASCTAVFRTRGRWQ